MLRERIWSTDEDCWYFCWYPSSVANARRPSTNKVAHATERLSDVQCKQAKPRDKAYKLSDGGGLMLLVFAVVLVTFLVDVTYALVDPRLRRSR